MKKYICIHVPWIFDNYKLYFFLLSFICFSNTIQAQEFRTKSRKNEIVPDSLLPPDGPIYARIIHGKVIEKNNDNEVPIATIIEEGTSNIVFSEIDGTFSIKVNLTKSVNLVCKYLGFETKSITLNANSSYIHFKLEEKYFVKKEVVVSASRKTERKFESPVTIEMINATDLRYNPTLNMFDRLANIAGVDVITTSVSFKTLNTRGFNSPYNRRFFQRFDNMDLSMPGFNFSLGMLNGPIDLDIASVELIPGSSSALYGPNIINGLINSTPKSAFDYKGLSVNYKTGVNHVDGIDNKPSTYTDFTMRYANTFSNNKWAYKFTLGYMNATDWKATDYRDVANYDFSKNLTTLGYAKGPGNPGYEAPNISGDEVTNVFDSNTIRFSTPGGIISLAKDPIKIARTGYKEEQLFQYKPYNTKADIAFYHRPNKQTEYSWLSRFSAGSSSFQIDNRAQISDFFLHQHKFEVKGKNYVFRTYAIFDNTGQTFDASSTAMSINRAAKTDDNWFAQYLLAYSGYFNILNQAYALGYDTIQRGNDAAARKFADGNNNELANKTSRAGLDSALTNILIGRAQFQPGTKEFDSAFNNSINRSFTDGGSRLKSVSKSWYTEFIYDFKNIIKPFSLLTGINYRLNAPSTQGTIFNDKSVSIYSNEIGGFAQASKTFFDDRLKIQASGRLDYMQRFDPRISPRASIVLLLGQKKQHSFRASAQIGYRFPALIEQFNYIVVPHASTIGGFYSDAAAFGLVRKQADGSDFVNVYIQSSVSNYFLTGDSTKLVKPNIKSIEPEELRAFELGHRTFLFEKLETDFSFYVSNYLNLITTQQLIGAVNHTDTVTSTYIKDPQKTQIYRMVVNSKIPMIAYGYSFSVNYYFSKKISILGNYNFNQVIDNPEFYRQDFVASFNTPKHKYNIGFNALKIKKQFGFSMNLRWVDQIQFKEYNKEGLVNSYYNIDMMVSYNLPKYKTMLKIGGSNVTNERYIQSLGAPTVGAVYYFSILFDELLK